MILNFFWGGIIKGFRVELFETKGAILSHLLNYTKYQINCYNHFYRRIIASFSTRTSSYPHIAAYGYMLLE